MELDLAVKASPLDNDAFLEPLDFTVMSTMSLTGTFLETLDSAITEEVSPREEGMVEGGHFNLGAVVLLGCVTVDAAGGLDIDCAKSLA